MTAPHGSGMITVSMDDGSRDGGTEARYQIRSMHMHVSIQTELVKGAGRI
jgi:hypothetical protein